MKSTKMLKKNYEFKNVLSKGKFYVGKKIKIVILKNKKDNNYLGIAIGTKNGKAFQRNRIKRLIREAYKNIENSLESSSDIVVLMKKNIDIKDVKYKDILEDMRNIFKNAEIIRKEEKI